jgi:hypothetical protein
MVDDFLLRPGGRSGKRQGEDGKQSRCEFHGVLL